MVICFKYLDEIYNSENFLITNDIFSSTLKNFIKKVKSNVFDKLNYKQLIGIFISIGNNRYEFIDNKLTKIDVNYYFANSGIRQIERNSKNYFIDKIKVDDVIFKIYKEKKHIIQKQNNLDLKISKLKAQLNQQPYQQPYQQNIEQNLYLQLEENFDNFKISENNDNTYIIKIKEAIPINILATKWNKQQINSRLEFIKDYISLRFEEIKNIINDISINNNLQIIKYNKSKIAEQLNSISSTNTKFPKIYFTFILG